MKVFLLLSMSFLFGCGNSTFVPLPLYNNYVNIRYNIGEVVNVRSTNSWMCTGVVTYAYGNNTYLLNPVICGNFYYYNVLVSSINIFRSY